MHFPKKMVGELNVHVCVRVCVPACVSFQGCVLPTNTKHRQITGFNAQSWQFRWYDGESLASLVVSVDVEHHGRSTKLLQSSGAVWTGRWPGLSLPIPFFPRPNKPYGFCGREAPWQKEKHKVSISVRVDVLGFPQSQVSQELCGSRGGRPGLPP